MRNEGSTVSGIATHTTRPLPTTGPGQRPTGLVHQQRAARPVGLDWDALYPVCKVCGVRSPKVHCETGVCDRCSGVATQPKPAPKAAPVAKPKKRAPRRAPEPRVRSTPRPAADEPVGLPAGRWVVHHGVRRWVPTAPPSGSLRARLDELGVTAAEVKAWAFAQGLILEAAQPGVPPRRVVDAYAEAHPTGGAA